MPAQSDEKSAEVVRKLQAGAIPHKLKVSGMAPGLDLRDHQKAAVAFLSLTEKALLFDEMGLGKCLDNTTNVLTPNGWVSISSLKASESEIIGVDGKTYKVTGVYPQGPKEVVEVEFSDRTTAQCCEDHLWTLVERQSKLGKINHATGKRKYIGSKRHSKTASTAFFSNKVLIKACAPKTSVEGSSRWSLPAPSPIPFPEKKLPIDPYTLGLLLGDGSLSTSMPRFTSGDPELAEALQKGLQKDYPEVTVSKHRAEYGYGIVGSAQALRSTLQQLNLQGKRSWEKHIPEDYLWASVDQRLALLQGLMDTGGTTTLGCAAELSTTSEEMAHQTAHVARSLGGVVRVTPRVTFYTYKGERRQGRKSYRVAISLDMPVFRLQRKLDKQTPYKRQNRRLKEIRKTGRMAEMTCISVDSPDNLFLIDGFVPTHNTNSGIGLLSFLAGKDGKWSSYPNPRTVIVTTAPNVRSSWQIDGFERFFPDVKIAVARGTKKQRLAVYNDTSWDVLITAYSTVRDDRDWITQLSFSTAILDECDVLGNPSSLVTQATKHLVRDCSRRIGMTGTPFTEKKLMKFHSMMDVIGIAQDFSPSKTAFEKKHHEVTFESMWVKRRNKWTGEMTPQKIKVKVLGNLKNVNEFREQLRPYYLRRTKKDVNIKLPELRNIVKFLDPTPEQERLYKQAQQGFLKLGSGSAQELERAWEHLRAICNNAALVGGKDSSAKTDWIEAKLLGELANDQVVIFNDRLLSVELMEKRFKKAGINFTTVIGATTEKKRLESIKKFREDSSCQVLLGTRTLVRGLNLQTARAQINVSLMPNPGEVAQVAGRIVRDGSVHEEALVISLFILNTMEHGWYKHVSAKQGVSDYVLQESSAIFAPLTPKEQFELIRS